MNELFRALPALLKEFDDNPNVREAVVFAAWRKIAGENLREHAVPFQLVNKHLVIAVMNETWKKHLVHLSGQMIFKINSALGQALVTFIEFRIEEKTVLEERRKFGKSAANEITEESALGEITEKMRFAADSIKDDNLRYQFLLAAGSCLVRKKNMANNEK